MQTTRSMIVLVLLATSAGCSSKDVPGPGAPAPRPPMAPVEQLPEAKPQPAEPRLSARVFVDTSGSMFGFFGRRVGNKVTALHSEVDAAIAELGLGAAKKCTVGETVKCSDVPMTPAELGNPSHYHERTSCLDRTLARAPLPAKIDPNHPPDPDLLDDAKLTLLITDGMEASGGGGAAKDASPCASGADPVCLTSLLRARIDEGYGVWFIGVLLPFEGTHYPERPLIDAYFKQAKDHVAELKFDARNLGVTFGINGRLSTDSRTGTSSYPYEGYKPLLVLVLSRDVRLGRSLVTALAAKLKAAPIQPGKMKPEDTVQSLELAPLNAASVHPLKVEMAPPGDQQGIPPAALAEFRVEGSAPIADGVSSKVWCGSGGKGLLVLSYQRGDDGMLPHYLHEEVVLTADKDAPPGALAPPVAIGAGRVRTGVNCSALPKGHTELRLALETRTALDDGLSANEWWTRAHWSSEDNWKMPERLYGLDDLVLPILRARSARTSPWGTIRVHVQRD